MNTIHIVSANQGNHMLFGNDVVTIKAWSHNTSGTMLVFETLIPAGGGPPTMHRHEYAEVFYFLEGEFEVSTLDDANMPQTMLLGAGDTVAIPSMVWHNFKNAGSAMGKLLAVHTPPVMEALLHEIGQPIADPLNPPMPDGPPSHEQLQAMLAAIQKYIEFWPPEAVEV